MPTRDLALDKLRRLALSGRQPHDEALPSTRVLGSRWGLNHNTVARAIDRLVVEGVLRRQGRKTYLQGKPPESPLPRKIWVVTHGYGHVDRFIRALEPWGIEPVVRSVTNTMETILELNNARRMEVDGLLVFWTNSLNEEEALYELRKEGLPFVICLAQHPDLDSVSGDPAGIALQLSQLAAKRKAEEVVLVLPRMRVWVPERSRTLLPDVHEWLRFALNRLPSPPKRIREINPRINGDVDELVQRVLAQQHPDQLILTYDPLADALFEGLRHRLGEAKPGLLSLGRPARNPTEIAWVDGNLDEEIRVATMRLFELCRHRRSFGVLPAPLNIHVSGVCWEGRTLDPKWRLRRKSVALQQPPPNPETQTGPWIAAQLAARWPSETIQRQQAVQRLHQEPFTPKPRGRLRHLPLVANMPTTGPGGWFGSHVLLNLKPGIQGWHGITFALNRLEESSQVGFIRLDSVETAATPRKTPIGHNLVLKGLPTGPRAVYFLHAAGFCQSKIHFADLFATHSGGPAPAQPWITAAENPFSPVAAAMLEEPDACVSEWWPNQPRLRNAHTLPVIITGPDGDPLAYERHLYIHRWIPDPALGPLKQLEIRLRPGTGVRYGLLAVTVEV